MLPRVCYVGVGDWVVCTLLPTTVQ